jgi:NADPH:quinone reductase
VRYRWIVSLRVAKSWRAANEGILMQAVQASKFGDPTVLRVVDLPDPTPGPGQIAIDVSYAAVGLIDVFLRQGLYKDRPGLPQPPFIPGLEVAGTVRELGGGVTGFAVGERVVTFSANGAGGYASIYVAAEALVVSTEGYDIDPAVAAAVVPNAAMAHLVFANVARLSPGESVLIHGALGGFAAAFPGIARQLGASRWWGRSGRASSARPPSPGCPTTRSSTRRSCPTSSRARSST